MRQFARILPVVAVAAVVVFAAANLKSQDKEPPSLQTWEYATVIGYSTGPIGGDSYVPVASGNAQICFVTSEGCRYESVQASNELSQVARNSAARNYNQALAKAAARLGAEAWELTNTVAVGENTGVIQMYYRRPLNHR
jgi:hypothetical protein